jgi:hypothetical protein
MTSDAPTPASDPEPLTDKARRKAEKKVRKEEKKLKKALKKAAKKAAKANDSSDDSSSESDDDDTPSSSTPATGASTPTMFAGRGVQAARHRHIMMKKRASMDPQALKEVCLDAQVSRRMQLTQGADFHDQDASIKWVTKDGFACIARRLGYLLLQLGTICNGRQLMLSRLNRRRGYKST